MPTERDDAAAGATDVAEQELDDRGGTDDLHADGVLRPADRVDERARPLAPRVLAERFRDMEEVLDGAAARLCDELRRVARVVALHDLEDAVGILHRLVLFGRLTVCKPAAVAAVTGLLAARVARLLTGGRLRLRVLVRPRRDVVLVR